MKEEALLAEINKDDRLVSLSLSLSHVCLFLSSLQETGVNEKEWVARLKSTLKQLTEVDYEKIAMQALWGIRLTVLVKSQHVQKISHLQHSQVMLAMPIKITGGKLVR